MLGALNTPEETDTPKITTTSGKEYGRLPTRVVVDRLLGRLVGLSVGRSVGRSVSWSVCPSVGLSFET